MRNYILTAAFLSTIIIWSGAQDTVLCHIDRPYYFPGQIIYYSLSSTIQDPDSIVIQVQLGANEKATFSHYNILYNGEAHGYFQLPFDVPGGVYFFSINLFSGGQGLPVNLMERPISVVSTQSVNQGVAMTALSVHAQSRSSISLDGPTLVQARSTPTYSVKVEGGKEGDLISIAVRDLKFYSREQKSITIKYVEEIEGEIWQDIPLRGARILKAGKEGKPTFIFAIEPENMLFRFNWVDSVGNFLIKMPPFYGIKNLFFLDNVRNEFSVSLDQKQVDVPKNVDYSNAVDLQHSLMRYDERKKIYSIYASIEESVEDLQFSSFPIPVKPNYTMDVQDFSVRGSLADLLNEVITPIKFRRKRKGQYDVKVLYEFLHFKNFYRDDPVFFINGVLTRAYNYIANLPIQDVKSLDVYSYLESIRDLKIVDIGGIGVIEMLDPTFKIPEEMVLPNVFLDGRQTPIRYPVQCDTRKTAAQLRSLLYWQPIARLDASGSYSFDLPISDDITSFHLEVLHHSSQQLVSQEIEVRFYEGE